MNKNTRIWLTVILAGIIFVVSLWRLAVDPEPVIFASLSWITYTVSASYILVFFQVNIDTIIRKMIGHRKK